MMLKLTFILILKGLKLQVHTTGSYLKKNDIIK